MAFSAKSTYAYRGSVPGSSNLSMPYAAAKQVVRKPLVSGALSSVLSRSVRPPYFSNFVDKLTPSLSFNGLGTSASSPSGVSSGAPVGDYLGNGASVDYRDAELAQHYGMDASTAYQEALSNTGYQRSVKDMQAAGLNPAVLFGAGAGNPAFGVNFVSPGAAGNPSGYSVGASSAKSNGYFYKLFGNAGTLIGAVVKGPSGAFAGRAIGQAIGNLVDDITK